MIKVILQDITIVRHYRPCNATG